MNKVISLIAKDHKKWTRIVQSFGAKNPEDIVQNMYLKIHDWKGKYDKTLMYNDTEINYYFIFKVLRNLFLDEAKKKTPKSVSLEDLTFYEPSTSDVSFEYNNRLNKIKLEINSWHLYDQRIYDWVFVENKSMLELSNKSGIDYYSIYRSVKKIKKLLIKQLEQ